MRFTDRKTLFTDRIPLLSIRSIRTDRHMAYTDRYGAGVLGNPSLLQLRKESRGQGFESRTYKPEFFSFSLSFHNCKSIIASITAKIYILSYNSLARSSHI